MRRYWDSDCFLAWLQDEAGKASECTPVIRDAEDGKLVIVTSALTIAEVLYLKDHPPIPKEDAEKVNAFFAHEYIVISELDRTLAENARELVWSHGIRPKDAVHVASALEANIVRSIHLTRDSSRSRRRSATRPSRLGARICPGLCSMTKAESGKRRYNGAVLGPASG